MKGASQICDILRRSGVTDVFGLAGDGNYRHLARLNDVGIAFHRARHEAAVVAMADGYARSTGRVGVCTVTHGPGLTHAASSLVEVRNSRSPVLFLGSDTPTWPTAYSCQDLDQEALLSAIGLRCERISTVGTLARDLTRALAFVRDTGEPLAVLLPTDVQDHACACEPSKLSGLGKHAPIAAGVAGDVIATAARLSEELEQSPPTQRSEAVARRIKAAKESTFEDVTSDGLVDPRMVLQRLDSMLPAQRTICIDGGWHGALPLSLGIPDASAFVFSQAHQSVGLGIGAAIGVAIGRPDRLAVLVCGDGGLSMSSADLVTAAGCSCPILIVVINDGAYAAEVEGLSWLGLPMDVGFVDRIDFVAAAEAVGGRGATVREQVDLDPLATWLADPSGLFVLDCQVPIPIDYGRGGEADWIEHIWHQPATAVS